MLYGLFAFSQRPSSRRRTCASAWGTPATDHMPEAAQSQLSKRSQTWLFHVVDARRSTRCGPPPEPQPCMNHTGFVSGARLLVRLSTKSGRHDWACEHEIRDDRNSGNEDIPTPISQRAGSVFTFRRRTVGCSPCCKVLPQRQAQGPALARRNSWTVSRFGAGV